MRHTLRTFICLAGLLPLYCLSAPIDEAKERRAQARFAEAAAILRPLVAAGDSEAQAILGEMYFLGQGVPADRPMALQLTERAANQRNPVAQYNLGYMYETGAGVPRSPELAKKWYLAAANQQYHLAQKKLADVLMDEGRGGEAWIWYGRASSLGNADARKIYAELQLGVREVREQQAAESSRRDREREEDEERERKRNEALARAGAAKDDDVNYVALLLRQSQKNAADTAQALHTIDRMSRPQAEPRVTASSEHNVRSRPADAEGPTVGTGLPTERQSADRPRSLPPLAAVSKPQSYVFTKGWQFDGGMAATQEASCAHAREKMESGDAPLFKRLVKPGSCECSAVMGNMRAYHCVINAQIEVESPWAPGSDKPSGPATGISK